MPGNKNDIGEHVKEHLWCGTPDCCQECDTATPEVNLKEEAAIQLELDFEKDTNE